MAPIQQDDYPLTRFLLQNRFAFLFVALLLIFFMGPVIELLGIRHIQARLITAVGFAVLLVAAVFAISRSRRVLTTAILLAVPALLADGFRVWFGTPISFLVDHAFSVLFLGYVILVIFRMIFAGNRVTADTIFASLCAYLLLGTLWAFIYSIVAVVDAEAFSYALLSDVTGGEMQFGTESTGAAVYFSIVTMTTLGYGDIVPFSPAAKALAALQAVMGQLYLAVLVAWLVGTHVAVTLREKSD